MSPEDIKAINEALDIRQAEIDLEKRKGLNQSDLWRRFHTLKDAKRIVLDVNIVTIAKDAGTIRIHTTPCDGMFKTPKGDPKEEIS